MSSSGYRIPGRKEMGGRTTWHGKAFIMESLVLILFIIVSMAVLVQLLATSRVHGEEAYDLTYAVVLASNEAEQFNVNPIEDKTSYFGLENSVIVPADTGGNNMFTVTRVVSEEEQTSGMMYFANITVERHGKVVYTLDTSRYVRSGVSG